MEKFVMVYYYDNDRVEVSIRRGEQPRKVYKLNNEKRRTWINKIASDGVSHVDMTGFVTFSFFYPRR